MSDLKLRNAENGNPIIEGYFAKFNETYEVCPGWEEKIAPGAFARYLREGGEIKILWNHNSDIVMGAKSNNTARFWEDEIGLYGEVELNPKDTESMNGAARIERRDVTGASFGFDISKMKTTYKDDGTMVDELEEIYPLYEVSPCTFPAYEGTEIYKRNVDQHSKALADFKKRNFKRWKQNALEKISNLKKGE